MPPSRKLDSRRETNTVVTHHISGGVKQEMKMARVSVTVISMCRYMGYKRRNLLEKLADVVREGRNRPPVSGGSGVLLLISKSKSEN